MSTYAIIICIDVLMATALYLPLSTGLLSLLPIASMAIGAYGYGYLLLHGSGTGLAYVAGLAMGAAAGAVGGLAVNRLRAFSAAVASLAIVEVVQVFFENFSPTGQSNGLLGIPLLQGTTATIFITALVVVAIFCLELSSLGLRIRATDADDIAAECVGIRTSRLRLYLSAISGLVAAIAGIILARYIGYISPDEFGLSSVNTYLLAPILGGSSTVLGTLFGGVFTGLLPQFTASLGTARLLVSNALLIVVVLARPRGLFPSFWPIRRVENWLGPKFRSVFDGRRRGDAPSPPPKETQVPELEGADPLAVDTLPLLVVDGVRKRFGGVVVLDGVSYTMDTGEILGVIGANGAGKTTLLNVLTGLVGCDDGVVTLKGKRINGRRPSGIARAGIARTFQNVRLFKGMSVFDNVRVAGKAETDSLLHLLNLDEHRNRRVEELPYGIQRRVEIARSLATSPQLLLLDEPAAGMNERETAELAEVVLQIRALGIAVMLIEHNVDFVLRLADKVLALDRGMRIGYGAPRDVVRLPEVVEAYLGQEFAEANAPTVAGRDEE